MQSNGTVVQLGKRIRQLRVDANIKQADLAKAAGVNPSYLGLIERGERDAVTVNILENLAKALNVPLCSLFEGIGAEAHVDESAFSDVSEHSDRSFANFLMWLLYYFPLLPQNEFWDLVEAASEKKGTVYEVEDFLLMRFKDMVANLPDSEELAWVNYVTKWMQFQRDYFDGKARQDYFARRQEVDAMLPSDPDSARKKYMQRIREQMDNIKFLYHAEKIFTNRANGKKSGPQP